MEYLWVACIFCRVISLLQNELSKKWHMEWHHICPALAAAFDVQFCKHHYRSTIQLKRLKDLSLWQSVACSINCVYIHPRICHLCRSQNICLNIHNPDHEIWISSQREHLRIHLSNVNFRISFIKIHWSKTDHIIHKVGIYRMCLPLICLMMI